MNSDTVSLFRGSLKLTYPTFGDYTSFSLPILGQIQFPLGRVLMTSLFYLGLLSSSYIIGRFFARSGRWVWDYLKSMFNAKRYLNSLVEGAGDNNRRYYAVIYGTNKAGSAYAHFLASKGFNLIIIGRSAQPMNDIEISLK